MIKKNKIIAFIPAKKNSQGLENKNLKKLNGIALFEIAILNAKKSKFIDEIYLSSDSNLILNRANKLKINTIKRKKSLCKNDSTADSVILDFIKNYFIKEKESNEDCIIIYLQPTSPFRSDQHIDKAIKLFLKNKLSILISMNENKNFFKSFKLKNNIANSIFNTKYVTKNRQNLKKIYSPNGAIYIFYANEFLKNKKINFTNSGYYKMSKINSIDIDDKEDYELAKELSKKYLKT
jgi:N-acylneuraminate cytidylyltransferase